MASCCRLVSTVDEAFQIACQDSLTGSVEVNAMTPEMLLADIIVDDEAQSVLAGCQLHQIVDLINPLLVRFTLPSTMDDRRD